MQQQLSVIITAIKPLVDAINQHKAFRAITSIERLRRFSEIHVYAVWDFICLLKALQRKLTKADVLWSPPLNHFGCHLVNTLLAEEESDHLEDGRYLSHFELYLEAMQESGADIRGIAAFMRDVRQQLPLPVILAQNNISPAARQFISDTFSVIETDSHCIAASLAFARENITSGMFTALLRHIASEAPQGSLKTFMQYFQRHIELDSGKHSNQSQLLAASLCEDDEKKWQEAKDAAVFSLKSRLQLLDGIYACIAAE